MSYRILIESLGTSRCGCVGTASHEHILPHRRTFLARTNINRARLWLPIVHGPWLDFASGSDGRGCIQSFPIFLVHGHGDRVVELQTTKPAEHGVVLWQI